MKDAQGNRISDADVTDRIRCALRVKYEDKARFCLLEEVGNSTGFANAGWADAVLMHLWPSDGLHLWGFEIKASRGDWLRELKNIKKSENIARFCDRWIVVVPHGVVKDGELPTAWGLWHYNLDTGAISQHAPGETRVTPKYIHRRFFASLIRRTQGTLPAAAYVTLLQAAAYRQATQTMQGKLRNAELETTRAKERTDYILKKMRDEGFEYSDYFGFKRIESKAGAA